MRTLEEICTEDSFAESDLVQKTATGLRLALRDRHILLRALELACTPTCVVMETEEDQRAVVESLMDVQIRRAQEEEE